MAFKMKGFSAFDKTNETGDPIKIETSPEPQDSFAHNPIVVPDRFGDVNIIKPKKLSWDNPEDHRALLDQWHKNVKPGEIKQGGPDPDKLMAMNPVGSIGLGISTIYDAMFGGGEEGESEEGKRQEGQKIAQLVGKNNPTRSKS